MKKGYFKLGLVGLLIIILNGCSGISVTGGTSDMAEQETTEDTTEKDTMDQLLEKRNLLNEVEFAKEDLNADWEGNNKIVFEEGSIQSEGTGFTVDENNQLTISSGGAYVLSGKSSNANIIVNSSDKLLVRLIFNGLDLESQELAPIYVAQAEKVVITLADGTKNNLRDAVREEPPDTQEDMSGVIYSKDDLTINGGGQLTITANYKDGITGKDELKIVSGNYVIKAADDGVVGKDLLAIRDGGFVIESNGDGLKTTCDTDDTKGNMVLVDGTFQITSGTDGMQSENGVYIEAGYYQMTSGSGSKESIADDLSAKGIKAKDFILIQGGEFNLNSADDTLHCNGGIWVKEGNFVLLSGDDGIHADGALMIDAGTIIVKESYEGIEAADMSINGGTIDICSLDDGINVAGGADLANADVPAGGGRRKDVFQESSNCRLLINGGDIYVNASADGIDVNGSFYMAGGNVLVAGPSESGNGALDYDGICEINGGVLIAYGSEGMNQVPGDSSTQNCISFSFKESSLEAGSIFELKDAENHKIVEIAAEKNFQNILISSPDLKSGASYTVSRDGNEVVTFELHDTDAITYCEESGVTEGSSQTFGKPGQGGPRQR